MNYLDYNYPKPLGDYPLDLCWYLTKRYWRTEGYKGGLLDVGCGVGAYRKAFEDIGFTADGIDKTDCNLEYERIPYPNYLFDVVFSKSLIEHIHNTDHLLSEMKRVLKLNGLVICLTPDWETDYRMFYDDPTHIRPFTQKGLKQAFILAGFTDVKAEGFYQLPILWRHKWLKNFILTFICLIPNSLKYNRKGDQRVWIRHSKERMILLSARKGEKM